MKSAVYTKAGQVGLAEIDRPQIVAADDAIIKIVRTCRLSISVSTLPTGPLSKFLGNPQIIAKACSSHF